jgi:hypothetical protein
MLGNVVEVDPERVFEDVSTEFSLPKFSSAGAQIWADWPRAGRAVRP